jgi:hypothetical protein
MLSATGLFSAIAFVADAVKTAALNINRDADNAAILRIGIWADRRGVTS